MDTTALPKDKLGVSPEDDLTTQLLDFVRSATQKIRIEDYSFNLDPLVTLLIEKQQEGIDVALVLDKSQSAGPTERPEIAKLIAAKVPVLVGTSSKHKIDHMKVCIVDDKYLAIGSFNFTSAAESEDNFLLTLYSEHDWTAEFIQKYTADHDWILANEPGGKLD